MKVLFIIPKIFAGYPGALNPHLGIAYLTSSLIENKIDVEIVDLQLKNKVMRDALNKIDEYHPDLVGISLFSFGFANTLKQVRKLRDYYKGNLVIGGPHVSSVGVEQAMKQFDYIDFAVAGEGEHSLVELCNAIILKKNDFSLIKGLAWRKEGKLIINPMREWFEEVDNLPFPAYEKFALDKYTYTVEKRLPIMTSRGCPYRCIFCSVVLCSGRNIRARSPENVIKELNHWCSKGYRIFEFVDDCFTVQKDRAIRICDLIIREGMEIEWIMQTRVDRVDEELLNKARQSGCKLVQFGIESGKNRILKVIHKGFTIEEAIKAVDLCKKVGITCNANFIIGHPTETITEANETLDFAVRLVKKEHSLAYFNLYNLIPYPGTELYEWINSNGNWILDKETYLTEVATRIEKPVFDTPEFPLKDRLKVLHRGFSLARKTNMQFRLGKLLGYFTWLLSKNGTLNYFGRKVVMGSRLGRRIFNWLKHQ